MKKNIIFIAVLFGMLAGTFVSCEDSLETGSDRQLFDPSLTLKTDSIYYTLGILRGVQDAIDQYVIYNEIRGDLAVPNEANATTDLKNMSSFSDDSTRYDSAYVYYRVINNCNYYIAHRDTTLRTGSIAVALPEYAQAYAIRAWAYLQLVKIYGEVPFYTEPITTISQAELIGNGPKLNMRQICDQLAPDLEKYKEYGVPNYGTINVGSTNMGVGKSVESSMIMFPAALVLGDWYLETNQYEKAAKAYFSYLKKQRVPMRSYYASVFRSDHIDEIPNDFAIYQSGTPWSNIFAMSPSDVITYVPLSVNKLRGAVTNLPKLFGYDFYITPSAPIDSLNPNLQRTESPYLDTRQIDPSSTYMELCNSQPYYYYSYGEASRGVNETNVFGDLRRYSTLRDEESQDTKESYYVMTKFNTANVPVYRATTVYLRMAEALNRAGYPDAAFAILKSGINPSLADTIYMKAETREYLKTTIPFLAQENREIFVNNYGIHSRGSGITRGGLTPYQLDTIVKMKMIQLDEFINNGGTGVYAPTGTIADTINAVEDILCDEYALEMAFEGNRFGDLCRLARHKNDVDIFGNNLYGPNFGGLWLSKKLAFKNPLKDLTQEANWYIPFRRD